MAYYGTPGRYFEPGGYWQTLSDRQVEIYTELDPLARFAGRPDYSANYNPPAAGATRSNGAIKMEALGLLGGSRDSSGSKYYLGE